jgi:tRNA uridine 5-carboxymethylaminomethyl modification enzyme
VRFSGRESHPVVLEFEGLETEEIYAKGLGNSMPPHLQERIVRSVTGLEAAEIMRWAYAIEYDFIQPTQLLPTLETKRIRGLYLAGQINGTSGYEEAAAQGLWAGINAASAVQGREPFVLRRSEAYLGVLIDDLVTRGVDEPYRMFTSRAEYRLILREDNATLRLMEKGHDLGLVSSGACGAIREKARRIETGLRRLSSARVYPVEETNRKLHELGTTSLRNPASHFDLLKREGIAYDDLAVFAGWEAEPDRAVKRQLEIEAKYEGYIRRQREAVEKMKAQEETAIPPALDYDGVPGLSNELCQKLKKITPATIAQAGRIPGMTQAALASILVILKKMKGRPSGRRDESAPRP